MTKTTPPKHVVLYADDDEDDLQLVRDAFREYATNVDVITFVDGVSLVNHLKRLSPMDPQPCLLIIDINMPIMNGKETLREIRSMVHFENTPVVLFTTSSLPFDRSFATKHKAGFITKPLTSEQLSLIAEEFISYCADDIRANIRKKTI